MAALGRRPGFKDSRGRLCHKILGLVEQSVEPVAEPVEFLLQGDHAALEPLRLGTVGRDALGRRDFPLGEFGRTQFEAPTGEGVEFAGEGKGFSAGIEYRKALNLGSVMLETSLPCLVADPSTDASIAFVLEYLLHPETSGRAIQKPNQGEMVLFRGTGWEFDSRCSPVEQLAAPVEHKVVEGCDERKSDRERPAKPVGIVFKMFVPRAALILQGLAEDGAILEQGPISP
jgi:hypothetical protein